jgi:phosphomannomutase
LVANLLKNSKCKVTSINTYHDSNFGGIHPEPIKKNLLGLIEEVKKNKVDIGIATDGDADRVAIIDDTGRYLTPHHVFPLLLYYLCEGRGMKGKVVQTVSLGYLSERIARAYGFPFQEVAVGFKYIAQIMLSEDMLIGGEESGGYSMKGYIPDRDGLLNSLLFVEMIAKKKKKLSAILEEVEQKFGRSCFDRIDARLNIDVKGRNLKEELTAAVLKNVPSEIAGLKVNEVKTTDGVKFMLGKKEIIGGEAWLLMRPSGTEPLVRIYAEASSTRKMKEILLNGNGIVDKFFKNKQ